MKHEENGIVATPEIVEARFRAAYQKGLARGKSDEREDIFNPAILSGEWAGESMNELIGSLWRDLDEETFPDMFVVELCDRYESGYRDAFDDRLFCDECSGLVSALDGVADDAGFAFCGSMRGNGCADRLIAEGRLPA